MPKLRQELVHVGDYAFSVPFPVADEIERLRAALERIANLPPGHICDARDIAREALQEGESTRD